MVTGNPPNNPLNQQQIDAVNQSFRSTQQVLADIFDKANAIQNSLKEQLISLKDITAEKYNQFDLEDKLNKALEDKAKVNKKISDLTKELSQNSQNNDEIEKRIRKGFQAKVTLSSQLTELRKKEIRLAEISDGINKGTITNLREYNKLINSINTYKGRIAENERKVSDLNDIILKDNEDLVKLYGEQGAEQINQLIAALEQADVDKNLVQNLKAKLKFAQANNDEEKDRIEYLKKQFQLSDKQKQVVKDIGTQLKINELLATLTLTGLLKGVLAADQATTDFARNLGISRENALGLTIAFKNTQNQANNFNKNLNASLVTIENVMAAQNELNASFGTANTFTDQQVQDQIFLTKQIGLSGVEASNVLKLGLLNQQSAEETTNTVADTVVQLRAQTGVALNFRKILSEVAKISGQLAAQYKNNPKLLAQAVTQAQLLGLNLEQTAKQANALLNFETSIENELKAELLTGKALNFERARALALQGRSAEAAAELMREAGGLEEFQKLNVIQQRALAESVGLTADEMADSVKQQKLLQETGFGTFEQLKAQADSIKDQTARQQFLDQIKQTSSGEQLVAQYQQVSLQEKFNGLVQTLQQNIVKLAEGPLGTVLHSLTDMLTKAESLKNIFRLIGGIIAFNIGSNIAKLVTTGLPGMIRGAQLFAIRMKRGAYAAALTSAFAGNVAGLLAGVAAFGIAESLIDSKFSGEGGDIGTVPMSGGGVNVNPQTAAATSRANSNQAVLDALNKNNALLEKNLNKSQTVTANLVMNGDTVGKLSTNQSMNSTKNMG